MIKNTSQCGYLATMGFYRVCTRQRYALSYALRFTIHFALRYALRYALGYTIRYALSCTTSWVGGRQRGVKEAESISGWRTVGLSLHGFASWVSLSRFSRLSKWGGEGIFKKKDKKLTVTKRAPSPTQPSKNLKFCKKKEKSRPTYGYFEI